MLYNTVKCSIFFNEGYYNKINIRKGWTNSGGIRMFVSNKINSFSNKNVDICTENSC